MIDSSNFLTFACLNSINDPSKKKLFVLNRFIALTEELLLKKSKAESLELITVSRVMLPIVELLIEVNFLSKFSSFYLFFRF